MLGVQPFKTVIAESDSSLSMSDEIHEESHPSTGVWQVNGENTVLFDFQPTKRNNITAYSPLRCLRNEQKSMTSMVEIQSSHINCI